MAQGKSKAPQDILSELGVDDLYSYIGVEFQATDKEITSAYRKKALKYHPDKNPDDPTAAERFQRLSKAYNILTDPAAKAAYDKWLRAKQRAKVRHQELDAKRRKMKEKLESKESEHVQQVEDEREAAKLMQKEIERLREEGFRKVKEQEELLRQQLSKGNVEEDEGESDELPTLKVTWKAKKSDETNGGYTEQLLKSSLSQFGPIHHILVSSRKKGKAIVSFHHAIDAQAAVGHQQECGLVGNPLSLSWLSGEPKTLQMKEKILNGAQGISSTYGANHPHNFPSGLSSSGPTISDGGSLHRDTDYESITLMRLRQAQERKRLAEQLAQQDENVD